MRIIGILVALTMAGAAVPALGAVAIGGRAPLATVAMENVDGRQVSIADAAGPKGTLVIFSCNHCPYVKAWESRMVAIATDAAKRGIGVIVINANDPEAYPEDAMPAMQQRAREKGYTFPYVVDATSEVARAFGATKTPEVFLFDAGGSLVYHGAIDDNAQDEAKVTQRFLADAVEAVLAGREVATKETKAIGCSIKFRKPRA
mgnify:CR=1 FL=1